MRIAEGGFTDNGDGSVTANAPAGPGALKSSFTTDGLGRVTRQQDWTGDGTGVAYDRQVTFDAAGRITAETDVQKQGSDTYTSYITNQFSSGSGHALGAITAATTASYKKGSYKKGRYQQTSGTTTNYAWYDAAVQSSVVYKPDTNQGTSYTTSYTYTGNGVFQSATVADGRPHVHSIKFVLQSRARRYRPR